MSRRKDDDMIWLLLLVAQYMLDGCYQQGQTPLVVPARVVPPADEAERMIDKGAAALKKMRKAAAPVRDALYGKPSPRPLTRAEEMPGSQLTRQAVLAIAQHAKFADPKLASAIAFAESGGVPGAMKRSSKEVSVGLWQINTMVHPYSVADMRDPIKNARAAHALSKGGTDWSRWTTYQNGKYKQFQTGLFA